MSKVFGYPSSYHNVIYGLSSPALISTPLLGCLICLFSLAGSVEEESEVVDRAR